MPALKQIAVIGASLAGLNAVEALRGAGYDGTLTLIGAEPGLPYDRPPLSKQILAGAREPDFAALRKPKHYDALDLNLRLGRTATRLDPAARTIELDGGETVGFDGLLITTGASPRSLPATPPLEGIYTLRTLEDCLAIREQLEAGPRVAVVGAGFIGSEVAATARGRGLDVTLMEAAPVPLVGAVGEGFDGTGRVERVRLADGAAVESDLVVVGVGVAPNTRWLESSGLDLRDGVLCDETCATNAPGVYAAGDVARWRNPVFNQAMRVEHWTNAVEQGRAAALNLLAGSGATQPFASVPYFWSDQY